MVILIKREVEFQHYRPIIGISSGLYFSGGGGFPKPHIPVPDFGGDNSGCRDSGYELTFRAQLNPVCCLNRNTY